MIKVKIQNPNEGRNRPTFAPLIKAKNLMRDYSIDITDSDDFDYLFIGMQDFIDKKRPLSESVEWGLENLSKVSGDYFLFDGSDSTSMMGAFEVFERHSYSTLTAILHSVKIGNHARMRLELFIRAHSPSFLLTRTRCEGGITVAVGCQPKTVWVVRMM